MVEAMQDEVKNTKDVVPKGSLFPDLAPYGIIRPPTPVIIEGEPAPSKPLPPRQLSISERPLKVRSEMPQRDAMMRAHVESVPSDVQDVAPEARAPMVKKTNLMIPLIIGSLVILCGLLVGIFLIVRAKNQSIKSSETLTSTTAKQNSAQTLVIIPIYIPSNLPKGYTFNNDKKTVSQNVFSMSVTGPNKEYFYITQQTPPVNNDYTPFNKQLTDPRSYEAPIGKVTTGATKNSFIVSISTVKNTWVIINSPNTGAESIIKPLIDSLSL